MDRACVTRSVQAQEHRSDVTPLLAKITTEYEAAQRGLSGVAYGTSQHAFIKAKMEQIDQLHDQLHTLIGDHATELVAHVMQ
jgi:hypothetical protein